MRIRVATPIAKGRPFPHFGRAPTFRVFDVEHGQIVGYEDVENPTFELHAAEPHHHGEHAHEGEGHHRNVHATLSLLFKNEGVSIVVATHMGARAKEGLEADGIKVVLVDVEEAAALRMDPAELVKEALRL
ncbi:hypothetical protein HPY42_01005 [Coprothermobacteraceae bacterium]|nr:hypothetical protein [Coprothermobacteraceae bacterium]